MMELNVALLGVVLLGVVLPLPLKEDTTSTTTTTGSCIDPSLTHNCFTGFDDMWQDLDKLLDPIEELAHNENAEDGPPYGKSEDDIKEPTKTLTLKTIEIGMATDEKISKSPLGYLTRYGYLKGMLRTKSACNDTIGKWELSQSFYAFTYIQKGADKPFQMMDKPRCSNPDITFDEDDNLDEPSRELIAKALDVHYGTGSNIREEENTEEDAVRVKREAKSKRRKKRYAIADHGLDLNEKSQYNYYLDGSNFPIGLHKGIAEDNTDTAFKAWGDAIGSSITLAKVESEGEADVVLRFVPDEHDDWTFSGPELAHAPFPRAETHGNVHYRKTINWDLNHAERKDFKFVTVHELGHWLGMKHSNVEGSVMQPIFTDEGVESFSNNKLGDDDFLGVQMLYGGDTTDCPTDWNGFYGICYILQQVSGGIKWTEAKEKCEAKGATLVTIDTTTLNGFLLKTVSNGRTPYWVGRRSTDDGWLSGKEFDSREELSGTTRPKDMNPGTEKCLKVKVFSGSPKWEYINCKKATKAIPLPEFYICEKSSSEFTEAPPTTEPATTKKPVVTEELPIPCQNYVRGAIRRGNYMYIFGTNMYFKYYYTNSRPQLLFGYPKKISSGFPGVPIEFKAVVTNPYNRKQVYFIAGETVYEWTLTGDKDILEEGYYKKRGVQKKEEGKGKRLEKLFKTNNIMDGATTFDRKSIMLFAANGEVGLWKRVKGESRRMPSRYEAVDNWIEKDFFDTGGIDAVTEGPFPNYLVFFREDQFFLMRKSDGKMPKRFNRNVSTDFDKLEICDVIAPFTTEYPDNVNPDDALEEEDEESAP